MLLLDLLSLLLLYRRLLLLNLLLLLLVVLLLLRVPRMTGQRLLGRVLLMLLRVMLLVLLMMREDGVVGDGLAHGGREEHRRRVGLGLYLLARGRGALSRHVEGAGDMDVGGARRGIGDGRVDGGGGVEEVLRVGLGRLLRRVGLRLVGRGGLGSRRLLVGLGGVGGRKGGAASEARLGETQAVGIGPGRAQASHDGRGLSLSSVGDTARALMAGGGWEGRQAVTQTRNRAVGLEAAGTNTKSRKRRQQSTRRQETRARRASNHGPVGVKSGGGVSSLLSSAGRSRVEGRLGWLATANVVASAASAMPWIVEIAKRLQFPARPARCPVYVYRLEE
jgi:hypothetical protein